MVYLYQMSECEYIAQKVFGSMESRKKQRRFHALSASVSTLVSIWNDPLVHTFGHIQTTQTHRNQNHLYCGRFYVTTESSNLLLAKNKLKFSIWKIIKMMIVYNFSVQLVKNQSDLWIRCVLFVLKNVVVKMKRFEHVLALRCTCDLK